jgi:hypothetical protein
MQDWQQLLLVTAQIHPGIGVKTQFPVVISHASVVHGLLSLQTVGVEMHPAAGLQVAVEQRS